MASLKSSISGILFLFGAGKLNGQAEKLLGRFMTEYAAANGGKRPYIGTKFATYPWRLSADSLVSACKESSERLQRPVDVGQATISQKKKPFLNWLYTGNILGNILGP